jgi:hypothetical protein
MKSINLTRTAGRPTFTQFSIEIHNLEKTIESENHRARYGNARSPGGVRSEDDPLIEMWKLNVAKRNTTHACQEPGHDYEMARNTFEVFGRHWVAKVDDL